MTFTPDEQSHDVRWVDYGRDNYAGVSWSDIPSEDGRRIYIGWMSNWKYANLTPTDGWRSAMTVPREFALETRNGVIELIQRPVRELNAARKPVLALKSAGLEEVGKELSKLQLDSYELIADIELTSAETVGFKVRASRDEETIIGYDPASRELFVDRTRSGESGFHKDFAGRHAAKLDVQGGRLQLRIYVDACSVEVFACDGQAVITDLIFPDPQSQGLELFGDSGMILHELEIYALSTLQP